MASLRSQDKFNIKTLMLDPLSVIIKLAILSKKSIGTKLLIQNNCLYFQEPGFFQPITRIYYHSNKIDIQYLFNPIFHGCVLFLKENNEEFKLLFEFALKGIKNLMETYENCSIIGLCLSYYYCIIDNYLKDNEKVCLFYKDYMSSLYTNDILLNLKEVWSEDKKKIILELIQFLSKDQNAESNIKSLETIMENNDEDFKKIFQAN